MRQKRQLPSTGVEASFRPVDEVDALLADLARWSGENRADDAARSRVQERWLHQQAVEDARFAGLLLDLAERGSMVVIATTAGPVLRGRLAAIAADFVVLAHEGGQRSFVALTAVATVRPEPGRHQGEAVADRSAPVDATLHDVLGGLAVDRPRVQVVSAGGAGATIGELWAVGADVVTVRLDGLPRSTVYLRADAVSHVTVL